MRYVNLLSQNILNPQNPNTMSAYNDQKCDMVEFEVCEEKEIVLQVHRNFAQKLFRELQNLMEGETVYDLRQQYIDNIGETGEAYLDDIPCLWSFGRRLVAFRGPAMVACPKYFQDFIEEICGIYPIVLRFDGERGQYLVKVIFETCPKRQSQEVDACVEDLMEGSDEDFDAVKAGVDSCEEDCSDSDNRRFSEYGDRKCRRVDV